MKKHLQATAILTTIAIITVPTSWGATAAGAVSFSVEKGDTYTNLFGPDWEKAYRQNKATMMRRGKPVTSPDILIEGSTLTVTGDVRFNARASARVAALQQRRTALLARLAAIFQKLESPGARGTAGECRRMLENDFGFTASVDFAEAEISHLERVAQDESRPAPQHPNISTAWLATWCLVGIALAIAIFWQRQRPIYPEGAARYRHAIDDVRDAFKSAGNL